jgi:hypothetical protein
MKGLIISHVQHSDLHHTRNHTSNTAINAIARPFFDIIVQHTHFVTESKRQIGWRDCEELFVGSKANVSARTNAVVSYFASVHTVSDVDLIHSIPLVPSFQVRYLGKRIGMNQLRHVCLDVDQERELIANTPNHSKYSTCNVEVLFRKLCVGRCAMTTSKWARVVSTFLHANLAILTCSQAFLSIVWCSFAKSKIQTVIVKSPFLRARARRTHACTSRFTAISVDCFVCFACYHHHHRDRSDGEKNLRSRHENGIECDTLDVTGTAAGVTYEASMSQEVHAKVQCNCPLTGNPRRRSCI